MDRTGDSGSSDAGSIPARDTIWKKEWIPSVSIFHLVEKKITIKQKLCRTFYLVLSIIFISESDNRVKII